MNPNLLALPEISIGRIVHYKLSAVDVIQINERRSSIRRALGPMMYHFAPGNEAEKGQVFPAMIVRTWTEKPGPQSPIQLQVFLDGADTYWASSRTHRPSEMWPTGAYAWPTVNYPGPGGGEDGSALTSGLRETF